MNSCSKLVQLMPTDTTAFRRYPISNRDNGRGALPGPEVVQVQGRYVVACEHCVYCVYYMRRYSTIGW